MIPNAAFPRGLLWICRGLLWCEFFSTLPVSQADKMLFWKQKYMEPLETSYDGVQDIYERLLKGG